MISPTEPAALRALGHVTMAPERFGVDLMFAHRGGWFGVQRKEFADLLASMEDGRLGQQTKQMSGLRRAMVVVEGMGRAKWANDGTLLDSYARVTRDQVRSLLWSVRDKGIWVDQSDSLADTIALVTAFERWCKKPSHKALDLRPGPVSTYGKADNRDWQMHMLQGLPGIGLEMAGRIIDAVGMPLRVGVTRAELLAIDGLGPKRVDAILNCVPGVELPIATTEGEVSE